MKSNNVTVSVAMITYKHEKYLAQAIEGVLSQIANFSIELIVADDNSPDTTASIVQHYIDTHPNGSWIRYYRHKKNIGMMQNAQFVTNQCTGTFIAICEGDDYWIDNNKLQTQVDFLQRNKEYSICFHSVSEIDEQNNIIQTTNANQPDTSTILELAKGNFIHSLSVVYRKQSQTLPPFFYGLDIGDYPTHLWYAQFGKIKFISNVMGVYRIHHQGIWSGASRVKKDFMYCSTILTLIGHFDNEINKNLSAQVLPVLKLWEEQINHLEIENNNLSKLVDTYKESRSYRIGNIFVRLLNYFNLIK